MCIVRLAFDKWDEISIKSFVPQCLHLENLQPSSVVLVFMYREILHDKLAPKRGDYLTARKQKTS